MPPKSKSWKCSTASTKNSTTSSKRTPLLTQQKIRRPGNVHQTAQKAKTTPQGQVRVRKAHKGKHFENNWRHLPP